MAVNYRRLYEVHLGRTIGKEIHVHHIDHNRQNNSLSNLVAIPAKFHGQYHFKHRLYEQTLCQGLPPNRPSRLLISRYSFDRIYTEWYFGLSSAQQQEYILRCQDVLNQANHYARFLAAKKRYFDCLKKIKFIKRTQR